MNFIQIKNKKLISILGLAFLYLFIPITSIQANGLTEIFFCTVPEEVNKVNINCGVVSGCGIIPGIAKAGEKILSIPFDSAKCATTELSTDGAINITFPDGSNPRNSLAALTMTASQKLIEQRPASGLDFIQDKVYALTNLGTVSAQDPSTYYPGAGADLLRPIQAFWGWSVNFVFSFLILLILAIAFAIIFRQRLGGQADVTIQNSIPNIALALILVPLSYAISGLFIDAVTLGTNAVHGFLLGPGAPGREVYTTRNDDSDCVPYNPSDITSEACDRGYYADDERINIWNVRGRISIGKEIGAAIESTVDGGSDGPVQFIMGIFRFIDSVVGMLTGGSSSQFVWLGTIINFFVSILTIWMSLKIAWHLVQKFLTFLLMPIFAPFIFATVALPGNGMKSVISYAKQMGAASLAYIVTYLMFILTIVFTSEGFQAQFPDIRTGGYIPPLLGLDTLLVNATDTQATNVTSLVLTLVGIGIFFSIPNVLKSIDKSLGVEFAIPQFIKDPFVNMKESFDMTFRTAPSLAYRAGGAGLTFAGNARLAPGRVSRGFRDGAGNLRAGVNRFVDNVTGVAGTGASRMAEMEDRMSKQLTSLEGQKAALTNQMNAQLKNNDTSGARRTAREIGAKDSEIADLKSSAEARGIRGLTAESRKNSGFEIKFIDKNDNEGAWKIDLAEWQRILNDLKEADSDPTTARTFEIGKLKFTLTGSKFEKDGIVMNYKALIREVGSQTDFIIDKDVTPGGNGRDIKFNDLVAGDIVLIDDMKNTFQSKDQLAQLVFKKDANVSSTSDSISFKLAIVYSDGSQFLRGLIPDNRGALSGSNLYNANATSTPLVGETLIPGIKDGRPRRIEFALKNPVATESKSLLVPVKIDIRKS